MLHSLIQRDQTAQFTVVSTKVWLFAFNYNRHLFLGSKCQLSGDGPDADGKDNLICGESGGLTGPSLFFDCFFFLSLCSPSDRPPAPVNVSVMHLRSDSATVSWEVPEGDIIIGFSILQQVTFQTFLIHQRGCGRVSGSIRPGYLAASPHRVLLKAFGTLFGTYFQRCQSLAGVTQ